MWNIYKYIYYWLYTWQKKLWGEDDAHQFSAVSGMSITFMVNFYSICVILEIIQNKPIMPGNISKWYIILFGLIILLFHYFLFMYKNKFIAIENSFKNESEKERKRKGLWVMLYAFGSLALFVLLLFFGIWFNNNLR